LLKKVKEIKRQKEHVVGKDIFIRAKTQQRSKTDTHLMDRQNEGI
jgi:hypothetical protein